MASNQSDLVAGRNNQAGHATPNETPFDDAHYESQFKEYTECDGNSPELARHRVEESRIVDGLLHSFEHGTGKATVGELQVHVLKYASHGKYWTPSFAALATEAGEVLDLCIEEPDSAWRKFNDLVDEDPTNVELRVLLIDVEGTEVIWPSRDSAEKRAAQFNPSKRWESDDADLQERLRDEGLRGEHTTFKLGDFEQDVIAMWWFDNKAGVRVDLGHLFCDEGRWRHRPQALLDNFTVSAAVNR
jgi:hypothetical protein